MIFTRIALVYATTSLPEQNMLCPGQDLLVDMTSDVLKLCDAFLAVTAAARKPFLVARSNISVPKCTKYNNYSSVDNQTFLAAAAARFWYILLHAVNSYSLHMPKDLRSPLLNYLDEK